MDPAKEQQAPEAPQSLEDAISEQYDTMTEEVEAEVEAEAPESSPEPVEAADREERPEPREQDEEEGEEVEAKAEDDVPYDKPAPERWPAEVKEVYNSLPPEAKRAMIEQVYAPMQKSYTQRTQQLSETEKRLGPMLQAVEQHRSAFEQAGVDPVQAFNQNLAWSAHFARVGPEQGLRDMQAALGQKEGQQPAGGEDPDSWMTPTERALKAELDQLKQGVASKQDLEQLTQRQQQEAFQQQQVAQIQGQMAEFAKATTPDGAPKHPHLEQVAPQMAGLIRGGLVPKQDHAGNPLPLDQQLGQAYELAVRMDPQIQQAQAAQQQEARQAELVSAASRDVPAKAPAGVVDVQAGPLSDTISDVYDQLRAGRR